MIRVLLTGGAGYIGSHTAKLLAKSGFEPVTIDNLSTGHEWAVKWGPFIEGDIADQDLVRVILAEYGIEAVIHLAACASVAESIRQPGLYFNNNVTNSFRLFEVLRESSVRHVIFSSTCATYGVPQHVPITESHPQYPVNPYGESKLMAERMLHWYGQAHGISSICLRYFNAAGADPEGELGEVHKPETHLIPLAIQAAAGTQDAISIFGTDYRTPDGTAIRDYTHVMDLARAHVLALEYLFDGGKSDVLNLGTGKGHSVLDVIHTVESVCDRRVPARLCGRRDGDPAMLVADASKAREVLGWEAAYTDLTEIVSTAWNWHCGWDDSPALAEAAAG